MAMIIIKTIMHVLPEKQKEVLQTLLSLFAPLGNEGGCLSYNIYRDIQDENSVTLISEWETRPHLADHLKSDTFSVLLGTKSLLSEPLSFKILTVSEAEGMASVYGIRNNR